MARLQTNHIVGMVVNKSTDIIGVWTYIIPIILFLVILIVLLYKKRLAEFIIRLRVAKMLKKAGISDDDKVTKIKLKPQPSYPKQEEILIQKNMNMVATKKHITEKQLKSLKSKGKKNKAASKTKPSKISSISTVDKADKKDITVLKQIELFVKKERDKGIKDEHIHNALIKAGFSKDNLEKVIDVNKMYDHDKIGKSAGGLLKKFFNKKSKTIDKEAKKDTASDNGIKKGSVVTEKPKETTLDKSKDSGKDSGIHYELTKMAILDSLLGIIGIIILVFGLLMSNWAYVLGAIMMILIAVTLVSTESRILPPDMIIHQAEEEEKEILKSVSEIMEKENTLRKQEKDLNDQAGKLRKQEEELHSKEAELKKRAHDLVERAKQEKQRMLEEAEKIKREAEEKIALAKEAKKKGFFGRLFGGRHQDADLNQDVKKLLSVMDDLLGKLPDNEIDSFSNSKDFELYKGVMEKIKK